MQHITFEGTHFEIGFHWGSLLAKRGIFILERIPFPLTEERAAFAEHCLPAYQAYFPQILEEIQGIALGQGCSALSLQAALFSMYALPPACHCSCFAVSNEEHILFGRNSDFLTGLEGDVLQYAVPVSQGEQIPILLWGTPPLSSKWRTASTKRGWLWGWRPFIPLYPARDERRDVASLFPGEVRPPSKRRWNGWQGCPSLRRRLLPLPTERERSPSWSALPEGRKGAVPHGGTPLCLRRQPVSRPQSSGEKCPCY